MTNRQYDVIIIGAGPSGTVAGAMLANNGLSVLILEKQIFPRFSIGESLLPQCMTFLKKAKLDQTVIEHAEELGFQFKNGAAFHRNGVNTAFDFRQKFSSGPGTTFQVKRASFDKLLADEAENKGVEIRYQHQVTNITQLSPDVVIDVTDEKNRPYQVKGKFLLDASGFGRVLPRLLDLEKPSDLSVRFSYFAHFDDNITDESFDRNKIMVTVHPTFDDVWFWLIPFSDGTASIGVVGLPERFDQTQSPSELLQAFINQDPNLKKLLVNAISRHDAQVIKGYSADVTQLCGDNYALLGNAGEFLDPVFSSGVTIALMSADMAADLVTQQLAGKNVDWSLDYAEKLKAGVNTFRSFVDAWYDGRFHDIIFHDKHDDTVRDMLSAILAGYAWDQKNPYVAKSERRLNVLAEVCQS